MSKRPREMSSFEHMIITATVLVLFGIMLFATEGCSVVTNSDPQWEYPSDLLTGDANQ
jgi:hypothetical protein